MAGKRAKPISIWQRVCYAGVAINQMGMELGMPCHQNERCNDMLVLQRESTLEDTGYQVEFKPVI